MSTRKRTNPQSPRGQPLDTSAVDSTQLPPQRPKKRISKAVQPPLAGVSLTTFIYALVGLAALYLAVQSASIFAWTAPTWLGGKPSPAAAAAGTEAAKAKVHNFAPIPKARGAKGAKGAKGQADAPTVSVEDRINELADALGMPSGDLARAIAVAVREYVPPASLSSISAEAKETGGTHLVEDLLGEDAGEKAKEAEPTAGLFERVVGMDEPPSEQV